MQQYQNKSGRSGITDYEFTDDGVLVTFKNKATYMYPIKDNDTRSMETLHGLLDHGEYANRLINARQPNFIKVSGENAPTGDTRPLPSGVEAITTKFLSRTKDIADKFKNLKQKAMGAATNFREWLSARKQ